MVEMIERAERTAILADSSRFGRRLFAQVAPLDRVDFLVTDAAPMPDLHITLEQAGVRILAP